MAMDMVIAMSKMLVVGMCCIMSLSCTSEIKQDDGSATLICIKSSQDGGTKCLVIEYRKSTIISCMDGRTDSKFRGRLFTGEHPEHPGSRLVAKGDSEIIEAILHLDPSDVPLEQGTEGPYNIIEEFQKRAREVPESYR
jgi:hypothetical protein